MSAHKPIARQESSDALGGKTITYAGSMALNLNNIMGAAVVLLPLVNQEAGWLTPLLAVTLVFVFSSFAATMLCEAMQRVPGNQNFGKRFEYCTLVDFYWGRKWYYASQIAYNLSLQASNIAAMVVATQVLDNLIIQVGGHTYGLEYSKAEFIRSNDDLDNPWPSPYVISLGYVVNMAICVPFGWLNLDENMWFQWFSLVGLVGFTLEFVGQFVLNAFPLPDTFDQWHNDTLGPQLTPAFTFLHGQLHVVGLSVFAYAWVVTVPSWINEKKVGVSVNRTVWWPSFWGLLMKVGVGVLGAWAFHLAYGPVRQNQYPGADNILNALSSPNKVPPVTMFSAYGWNLTTMIPGIPVLAILVRYNLLNGGVCGRGWSFFWGVLFPWIVTAFLVNSRLLLFFCNAVAICVQGFINLTVPAALYRSALERFPSPRDRREGDKGHEYRDYGDDFDDDFPRTESGSVVPLDSPLSGRGGRYADDALLADVTTDVSGSGRSRKRERPVNAVPAWIPLRPRAFATMIIWFFNTLCVGCIGLNVYHWLFGLNGGQ